MTERKLRLKEKKQEAAEPSSAKEEQLTLADIAQEKEVSRLAKMLSNADLLRIIDEATLADQQQKALAKIVAAAKAVLLAAAEHGNWRELSGEKGICKISPSTSTEINPTDFVRLLKQLEKTSLFDSLVKVATGDAKKYLGLDVLEPISKVETRQFGTVTLKPL